MQRRLILMRHAKSAWDSDAERDHDRPLAKRGKRDAARIARELQTLGWLPDHVYTSTARRARQTWKRMMRALEDAAEDIGITRLESLYMAGLPTIRDEASDWPAEHTTVLVLGHNPGWEEALHALTGSDEAMTTGNAALLVGEGATWAAALAHPWRRVALLRPRELAED
ncbi:MAG: histidine phosphatase family protein [Deltaproteobacteria bacterium]|nr:MAG: histidine phosphatase family protein [Deltaproteobacteria bacterium]